MKYLGILGAAITIAGCSAEATGTSSVKADKAFDACEAAFGRLYSVPAEVVERSIEGATTRFVLKFVAKDGQEFFPEVGCNYERRRVLTERDPVFVMKTITLNEGMENTFRISELDSDLSRKNAPTIGRTLEELSLDVIREDETDLRLEQD